jgi:hypothetical protein
MPEYHQYVEDLREELKNYSGPDQPLKGVPDDVIRDFKTTMKSEYDVVMPDAYIQFHSDVGPFNFDGTFWFAPSNDNQVGVPSVLERTRKFRKRDISNTDDRVVLGFSDIEVLYVFNGTEHTWEVLDNEDGMILESFDEFDEFMIEVLSDTLGYVDDKPNLGV